MIACNTASTLVLPALRAALRAALRRHRAGDQAGLRGIAVEARLRARHRSDRRARIHPRADPQLRPGLRSDAGRLGAASPRSPKRRWQANRSTTRRSAPRSRPASSRTARAHRHDGARLHALPAAARPLRAPRAMAGALDRSRARDRAPGRRAGRTRDRRRDTAIWRRRSSRRATGRDRGDLSAALAGLRARSGKRVRRCRRFDTPTLYP